MTDPATSEADQVTGQLTTNVPLFANMFLGAAGAGGAEFGLTTWKSCLRWLMIGPANLGTVRK